MQNDRLGKGLTITDCEIIIEALEARTVIFPHEPPEQTIMVVLLNIGDRFAETHCVNGEWSGPKYELPKTGGLPKCPNGHVLFQDKGLKLGWLEGD